ncbi:MAG TPA: PHB depolymerase family esterase [Polyangiales bacterium]|nr:PHB depolymerase family esterase [Polyangiales bacterium]
MDEPQRAIDENDAGAAAASGTAAPADASAPVVPPHPAPASSACPTPGKAAPGDFDKPLPYAGLSRSYRVHVPRGFDATKPQPLVLVLHGLSVDGPQMQIMSAFDSVADKHGFIVVYPTSDSGSWNAGGCCNPEGPDDVAFMRLVVDQVKVQLCVDPKRIYATGMSNGALMSQLLGCKAADLFAAIAPVAGPLIIAEDQCKPARPISMLAIHGSNDTLLGYEDGGFLPLISVPGTVVPSAHASTAGWARRDQCASGPAAPTPKADWPREPISGGVVPGSGGWIPDEWAMNSAPMTPGASCEWYSECAADAEVGLCTHDGGHDWPTGSSTVIWQFFERHPMP